MKVGSMARHRGKLWYSGSLVAFLVACSPLRLLPEGEKLVAREPILRGSALEEAPPLYVRSNSRTLGVRLGLQIYWAGQILTESPKQPWQTLRRIPKMRYYTYKLGYALRENLGDPPALLSMRAVERDVALIEEAHVQEGYFLAAVQAQIKPINEREALVIYRVRPGPRWHIKELDVVGKDSTLVSLTEAYLRTQILPVGEPYRLSRLDALRADLYMFLLSEGYQGLSLSELIWEIDTTIENKSFQKPAGFLRRWIGTDKREQLGCIVRLVLPEGHKRYALGRTELSIHIPERSPLSATEVAGILCYTEPKAEAILDSRALIPRIYYPPLGYYDQRAIQASQKALQSLEVVQWVGPALSRQANDSLSVRYDVVLRPPIDLSVGIEGFQSTQPLVGSLPLPGASANLRSAHLSLFRRGWVLRTRGQVAASYFRRSVNSPLVPLYNIAAEVSLSFPEGTLHLRGNRPRPLPLTLTQQNSSLSASLQDIRQIDFSRRYATLSWTKQTKYFFSDKRQEEQIWTPLSLTFVDSRFSPSFEAQIEALSPLVRTLILRDYLSRLTQVSFWQVSTHRNYFSATRGSGDYSSLLLEIGGWIPFFLEHFLALMYPQADSSYRDNLLFNRFRYGIFLRVMGEGRWRKALLGPHQQLHIRGRIGWGQGMYYSLDLPFENRFFVGGPNSMRAWQFGALGPGRYTFPKNLFLIPGGTFLAEVNAELRQSLYRGIQLVPFVDIGNVWFLASTLFEDPRGLFLKSPIPGIAGGIGLRWDFSVIVIRLDIAQQILDPATGLVMSQFPIGAERAQYVFAVGYPF
ncbi:MAG: outer membrane protein assembly factor [Bacteroidia bacterium]|nr:outer membrane protein assembly factor [Bacteroidia bacterium]MDW8417669.1 BamA/TamA family outer membrane protein [Bacteroidia bacterium]